MEIIVHIQYHKKYKSIKYNQISSGENYLAMLDADRKCMVW